MARRSAAVKAAGLGAGARRSQFVIFGMPAEAIRTGAVDQVVGIDEMYATSKVRGRDLPPTQRVGSR